MSTHAPLAVEATALAKSFGGTRAVAGLDLAVPAGTLVGFLAPNGAGKTTIRSGGRVRWREVLRAPA